MNELSTAPSVEGHSLPVAVEAFPRSCDIVPDNVGARRKFAERVPLARWK